MAEEPTRNANPDLAKSWILLNTFGLELGNVHCDSSDSDSISVISESSNVSKSDEELDEETLKRSHANEIDSIDKLIKGPLIAGNLIDDNHTRETVNEESLSLMDITETRDRVAPLANVAIEVPETNIKRFSNFLSHALIVLLMGILFINVEYFWFEDNHLETTNLENDEPEVDSKFELLQHQYDLPHCKYGIYLDEKGQQYCNRKQRKKGHEKTIRSGDKPKSKWRHIIDDRDNIMDDFKEMDRTLPIDKLNFSHLNNDINTHDIRETHKTPTKGKSTESSDNNDKLNELKIKEEYLNEKERFIYLFIKQEAEKIHKKSSEKRNKNPEITDKKKFTNLGNYNKFHKSNKYSKKKEKYQCSKEHKKENKLNAGQDFRKHHYKKNNLTGDWYFKLHQGRNKLRTIRKNNAHWYFQWMFDRERLRSK